MQCTLVSLIKEHIRTIKSNGICEHSLGLFDGLAMGDTDGDTEGDAMGLTLGLFGGPVLGDPRVTVGFAE